MGKYKALRTWREKNKEAESRWNWTEGRAAKMPPATAGTDGEIEFGHGLNTDFKQVTETAEAKGKVEQRGIGPQIAQTGKEIGAD
jgi:hypothetical protein